MDTWARYYACTTAKCWRKSLVATGVALACAMPSCVDRVPDEGASKVNDQTNKATAERVQLQRELGFAVPEGARVLWIERENGIDSIIRVKLEMSKLDFDTMAASVPIVDGDLRSGPGRLGRDKGEWNPRTTVGLRSTQLALPDASFMNVGVAETAGVLTVFVMRHGT